jgi:hypothetical protein
VALGPTTVEREIAEQHYAETAGMPQGEDVLPGEQHLARGALGQLGLVQQILRHCAELRQVGLGDERFGHRIPPVVEDELGHGDRILGGVVNGRSAPSEWSTSMGGEGRLRTPSSASTATRSLRNASKVYRSAAEVRP